MADATTISPRAYHAATAEADLQATEHRLRFLLAERDADDHDNVLTATTTLLSNVAHFFVYLEGNRKYLDEEALLPWRERLLDCTQIRCAVLELLTGLRCGGPKAELVRRQWTERLRDLADHHSLEAALEECQLGEAVERTLQQISADRAALLVRLGTATNSAASPEAVFFRVISSTESAVTRAKLARAWDRQRDLRSDDLVDCVDRVVALRRARSRARAGEQLTPLAETLTRCAITAAEAESFMHEYLGQAVAGHQRLREEIRAATDCTDDPMNHFAFYLRRLTASTRLPLLPMQDCLDVAASLAEGVSSCTLHREDEADPYAITLSVRSAGRLAGQIRVDMLGGDGIAGVTQAAITGVPVGRALCRYQLGPGGERMLTFDSAQSLFHEFGHALTQVLVGYWRPGPSGLEYLPVERLENLSEWFDKWVFHPDFAARVSRTEKVTQGLAICRQAKQLEFLSTHLQRAVVGALDLDLHGRTHGGLRDSFRRLDEEFGVGRYCDLGDLPGYFTRPMFRANPGMGLVYLWGYAYGAERFAPFFERRLADLPSFGARTDALASCFNPDIPSERPEIGAVLKFYEVGLITTAEIE